MRLHTPSPSADGSLSEIKQLLRRDLQHLAELEDHIKGNAHVAQLDGAGDHVKLYAKLMYVDEKNSDIPTFHSIHTEIEGVDTTFGE